MNWFGENIGTLAVMGVVLVLIWRLTPRTLPRIGELNLNGNKITIIAVAIFVIAVITVYSIGAPSMRGTWEYGKTHWPMIIFLSLAGYIIAMFLPDGATDAEKSRQKKIKSAVQALAVAMPVFYFILAPLAMKAEQWTLPTVTCQDASAQETRSCILNSSWTAPLVPSSSEKVAGMRLCSSPDTGTVSEMKLTRNSVFWRFRATDGDIAMRYRLMANCPTGDLPP